MIDGIMEINGVRIDNSPIVRRIIQLTCDTARRPIAGLRALDLACAHGGYALELASRGARVLGIEGRQAWLEQARRSQSELALSNVEFVQDDVRNLSRATYGEFEIVLCLGILYHLDAPDVFDFIAAIADVCRGFAIFETHFAPATTSRDWRGHRYWGQLVPEHPPGATPEEKLNAMGASLEDDASFWITPASLCNVLRHVGFTSVSECRNPVAFLHVSEQKEMKMWGNRTTLLAMKGEPVSLTVAPLATAETEIDWPEDIDPFRFERIVANLGKPNVNEA